MKLHHSFLVFFICFISQAQNEFITTWEVTDGDLSIFIPTDTYQNNFTYDYTVDFGDGTVLTNQTDDVTHTYASAGTYTVLISGVFPKFNGGALSLDRFKLMTVEQWGNNPWESMDNAFENCYNLTINATDQPDLSNVTDMSYMFRGASSVNSQNIGTWDVSNVTDVSGLFENNDSFNQSLNNWDVSNVTDMNQMFLGSVYNQTLNNWDVSSVNNMTEMFRNSVYNQPLNNWDVSSVTNMGNMFRLSDFNQPLDNWDVSSVVYMNTMFMESNFNQPIESWDVSSVESMRFMFADNDTFSQPLDNWDVSNVTTMFRMFQGSTYNQPLNNWDTGNVTNMREMFRFSNYNQSIGNWDTSSVTTMEEMFLWSDFNQPIGSWDTSSVTNMKEMFDDCPYNHPLNNWDVSNVTNMESMFRSSNFNQPISTWDISNILSLDGMFAYSSFNQPLNDWDVSNITSMAGVFSNSDFNQPLDNWDVSNVQYMSSMFSDSNFNQDISDWDISNVTSIDRMFKDSNFNQDISSWTFIDGDLNEFIENSAMDSQNYDLLLGRFVQLGLEDGDLEADGLEYCDIFTRQILINNLDWDIDNDQLSSDCSINYISGNVRFDENGNGCDSSDKTLSQLTVNTNDGQNDLSVLTDDQGDYLVTVNQGNFSVGMLNLPPFLDASPSAHAVSFTNTDEIEEQKDFCITANQTVEDLSVDLFPLDDARPGFESDYELIVENNGTQPVQNAQVTVNFEDTKQSFVSASQTPSNTTSNSITFTIGNLPILGSEVINFTLLNVQPPALNISDIVLITADVFPDENDANPEDNNVGSAQIVVNSFDPNDKLITQGEQIPDEKIDEYLDYKIRFQNVGTANAINVVVTDTISDKLDWTTFQPINSSHNYRLELIDQQEVNFIFENINLPYEAIDEPGSNGHVSFKIKPKGNIQIGDIIENKAYIFFDFNAPIITNTVSTEIVTNLGTAAFDQAKNIKLSPNPAENRVEIINESNAVIQSLQLYSMKGQLMNSFRNENQIDVSSLSNGVYIMQIETQRSKINKRLIKR